jgi:hemolysin activation/secretion protein
VDGAQCAFARLGQWRKTTGNREPLMKELHQVACERYVVTARRGRVCATRLLAAAAGSLMLVGVAMAQPEKIAPPQKPLDVNNLRPSKPEPAQAEAAGEGEEQSETAKSDEASGEPAPAPAARLSNATAAMPGKAIAADGKSYKVGRFVLEWKTPNPQHPAMETLMDLPVRLAVTPEGYVTPYDLTSDGNVVVTGEGVAKDRTGVTFVTVSLKDLGDGGVATFYRSAVLHIGQTISDELNRRGIIVVLVHPADDQVSMIDDPDLEIEEGDDLREGQTDMRLIVRTGSVDLVRTLAGGNRLESSIKAGEASRVDPNDPIHNRIREQSPVNKGDLVRKDLIDEYLYRLNRHPGRRVDLAVAPGSQGDTVALDYTVTENKPWTAYFQVSNTGTEATNKWRERFGFVHNQLTKHDDILRVDYITGGFDEAHAVNVDYSFPIRSDSLRLRTYGGYSQYDAADVGFEGSNFSGESANVGVELNYNLWQRGDIFLDLIGGVKWQDHEVESTATSQRGDDNFFTPYLGVNLERFRDDSALVVGATVSYNADDLELDQKDQLGRPEVDASFSVVRFNAEYSTYLEPIFNRWGIFKGGDGEGMTTLAHEISISTRGQWSMDNRLIPVEEDVAGGLFTVRGYPESVAAGDNVIIASLEYRYHLANDLARSSVPGMVGNTKMPEWFGSNFRWAPQQPFGRADWDLIFKTFLDFGNADLSDKIAGEYSNTLFSTGLGMELIYRRNVSMRLDWGVALHHAGERLGEAEAASLGRDFDVEPGMNEWHFLLTISY